MLIVFPILTLIFIAWEMYSLSIMDKFHNYYIETKKLYKERKSLPNKRLHEKLKELKIDRLYRIDAIYGYLILFCMVFSPKGIIFFGIIMLSLIHNFFYERTSYSEFRKILWIDKLATIALLVVAYYMMVR